MSNQKRYEASLVAAGVLTKKLQAYFGCKLQTEMQHGIVGYPTLLDTHFDWKFYCVKVDSLNLYPVLNGGFEKSTLLQAFQEGADIHGDLFEYALCFHTKGIMCVMYQVMAEQGQGLHDSRGFIQFNLGSDCFVLEPLTNWLIRQWPR